MGRCRVPVVPYSWASHHEYRAIWPVFRECCRRTIRCRRWPPLSSMRGDLVPQRRPLLSGGACLKLHRQVGQKGVRLFTVPRALGRACNSVPGVGRGGSSVRWFQRCSFLPSFGAAVLVASAELRAQPPAAAAQLPQSGRRTVAPGRGEAGGSIGLRQGRKIRRQGGPPLLRPDEEAGQGLPWGRGQAMARQQRQAALEFAPQRIAARASPQPGQQGQAQGLLEVCLNSPGWVAAPTLYCAGTAPDPWPPSPPPRLLMQAI